MFWHLKNHTYSIGVDLGNDCVKIAQLADGKEGTALVAAKELKRPDDVKAGSTQWQRWAIDVLHEAMGNGGFRGKDVVAAMPAGDVFVDHVKASKASEGKTEDVIFSRIKQKLPFEAVRQNVMMKYVATSPESFLVMAVERTNIERHLAIYERAGLTIKSVGVWPVAIANCYARFFGRRQSDLSAVVMLLDTQPDCTNLVVSRHKEPLFACSIPIGAGVLGDEKMLTRLVFEIGASKRNFTAIHKDAQIGRMIFLSGPVVDTEIYRAIAKQVGIQAQMGDCLAAVECGDHQQCGIDRRNGKVSWATAFGLSVS